jgi:hypothetical protein
VPEARPQIEKSLDVLVVTPSWISSGLGEGCELGFEVKLCELGHESLGPHILRAAIEMIGTKILELRAVLEHVVDRRKERGRDRAGCLLPAAATAEATRGSKPCRPNVPGPPSARKAAALMPASARCRTPDRWDASIPRRHRRMARQRSVVLSHTGHSDFPEFR